MNPREKQPLLLVDDDSDVVWSVGRCLTRAGFVVSICGDGAEAVRLLESKEFEFLVTDIQMPGLNGLALIEWVRQNRPHIRVVVMTAFGSPSVRQVSLRKGALLYMEKPVDPDLLIEILNSSNQDHSFAGSVNAIDLFDYVQLMLLTKRQLILEVSSCKGEQGWLFIEKGNVLHAECGGLEGEDACYHCLSFEGGSFSSLPWKPPPKISITKSGEFLLMEAARLKDETGRGVPCEENNEWEGAAEEFDFSPSWDQESEENSNDDTLKGSFDGAKQ